MALPYVSPARMAEYRQSIIRFAKGADSVECIRSHYIPDRSGVCDLTGAKEQEELFILANRAGDTLKVSQAAMQIIANVVDIKHADEWYQRLKDQRRAHRERVQQEAQKKEQKPAAKTVVLRKKSPTPSP